MVGPSVTDEERRAANRRLQAGFVLLVAVSGGLVAVQVGGTPANVAAGAGAGLAVGLALRWFLLRWAAEFRQARRRPRRE